MGINLLKCKLMIVNYFKINEIDMLHNFTVVCGKIMHFMATAFFFHIQKRLIIGIINVMCLDDMNIS